MKKITISLFLLAINIALFAQTPITFEKSVLGTTGGTTVMWNGKDTVVTNAYPTGNSSTQALKVTSNSSGNTPVYFNNTQLMVGAENYYSKVRLKYLLISGTGMDNPTLSFYSSPNSYTAGTAQKFGSFANAGGLAEVGVWKTLEFSFSNKLLTVPTGRLTLVLEKASCVFLLDDV
jgi:hypothetical protein